jgi:hypothetical protein
MLAFFTNILPDLTFQEPKLPIFSIKKAEPLQRLCLHRVKILEHYSYNLFGSTCDE